jgi:hypothetical protein
MADVANTCPLEPTDNTTMEATTTMRSERFKWCTCVTKKLNTQAAAKQSGAFLKVYTEDGWNRFCPNTGQTTRSHNLEYYNLD